MAGKTGTTNEQKDAWFSGFNQSLVAVTWVGFDSAQPLGRGETGGRAALPAWILFMEEALKGIPDRPPEMPQGLVTIRIDPKTGLRANANQKDAFFEVFRTENAPKATAQAFQGSGASADSSQPVEPLAEDPF